MGFVADCANMFGKETKPLINMDFVGNNIMLLQRNSEQYVQVVEWAKDVLNVINSM